MKQYKSSEFNPYSRQIIEFATIGVSFAKDVESLDDKDMFIQKMLKTLPVLYTCINELPQYLYDEDEDFVETFVNEVTYEHLRCRLSSMLGDEDNFLSALDADIQYSETTVLANISEYLMDVYQNVVDLLGVIKNENHTALPYAIGRMLTNFNQYFSSRLLEALTALNKIYIRKQLSADSQYDEEQTN